jgi:hypothetical protein
MHFSAFLFNWLQKGITHPVAKLTHKATAEEDDIRV